MIKDMELSKYFNNPMKVGYVFYFALIFKKLFFKSIPPIGYSVLGWNHPGFGGSTGAPFPDQEANAVDTVMQFAINK